MKNENTKKLNKLNFILGLAIFLFLFAIWFYFNEFKYLKVDSNTFGTFGDFIGGTLNPLFALFSLFAIIYTIKIQTEELSISRQELKETKEELRHSRIAQEEQSKSLKLQNKATEVQIFENSFFNMLNVHNELLQSIRIKDNTVYVCKIGDTEHHYIMSLSDNSLNAKFIFPKILHSFYTLNEIYEQTHDFNDIYKAVHNVFNLGHYYGYIYQILKFIDRYEYVEKEFYSGLFRAQFTKFELKLLFYHCSSSFGCDKFKPLIEKFHFLEHLEYDETIDEIIFTGYNVSVYGKNTDLGLKYFKLKEDQK